ncbi:hypothetical protein BTO20_33355 [Mycobacterium dioxanotrophicus]|jgi:hypothetical protein|uniref:Uncharacterized protein n=2 Tax=Mycobacterium dioxanotrophicus TaxID=482462 RepID=A0A1Y0CC01_9MYCO|nr:hypothetical protein BTO20_33355 [Mycobacterium dioxanotrophicus]
MALVARALPRAVPVAIPAIRPRPTTGRHHRIIAAVRAWLLAPAFTPRPPQEYHRPHRLDFIEDAAMGREMLRL